MKKLLFAIAILAGLTACNKEMINENEGRAGQASQWYFSKVKYYYDGRQPNTDTVMTLRLIDDDMKREYDRYNGYIYADHSPVWMEIGRIWEKR